MTEQSAIPGRILPALDLDSRPCWTGGKGGVLAIFRWADCASYVQPRVAEMMWSRTDLKPGDVDVAQLYDGFTYHTLNWLENFGFCERYGAKDFVEGGRRIALEGELPVNTGGGALSGGRLHAYGAVHEACTQLWGRGGQRQVKGELQICATSTAGGPLAGSMLLVRD